LTSYDIPSERFTKPVRIDHLAFSQYSIGKGENVGVLATCPASYFENPDACAYPPRSPIDVVGGAGLMVI
jgi:hypothetical protein